MSNSETIKEFLVKLGWKVDETGKRKFDGAVAASTQQVLRAGAAAVAGATALAAFTHQMAKSAEGLYYISQRSGAAVSNIESVGYAASQLGSSVEDANAALENMGAFLRYNPGAEGFLNSMRIQTRDANGALKDTSVILGDLGSQLREMPPYLQRMYADFFKLSEKQLRAITSGDYQKFADDHNRRLKEAGVNMDELAKNSTIYEQNWRLVQDQLGIVGDQMLGKLLPYTNSLVVATQKFLENITATKSTLDDIKTTYSAEDYLKKRGIGGALLDSLSVGVGELGSNAITSLTAGSQLVGIGLESLFSPETAKRDSNWWAKTYWSGKSGSASVSSGSKEQQVLDYMMSKGWTSGDAAAMLANFKRENSTLDTSLRGDGGRAVGIAQWHPDRQQNFARVFGKNLADATLEEQLDFVDWELKNTESQAGRAMSNASDANTKGRIFSSMYERPADTFGQARLRGNDAERIHSGMQMTQNNNITVNGSKDSDETARAVERGITNANQSITRNYGNVAR